MSLNLYFLRHGETTYSQTGAYCGIIDAELTPFGEQMAQGFADAYKALHWDAVYVSPMKRTIATARPFCEATGMEMNVRDGLRELFYGEWEDQTLEDVRQRFNTDYENWLVEPAWNPPTGGETATAVANRAIPVVREIQETHPDGNVLLVSHKATIRILLCNLLGIDLGRYRDRIEMPVASISLIKLDLHGPLLQRLGDRAHLSPALRDRPGT